ncbi:murein hydrolase activator EnvC family protein [Alkalibacillus haloalkaliphilus]|uniref:murein hydrolase activator EnvC family protein n=1 Tax=Alkalibacillus haloalkaliphilus TaxID=94136 RepID=UPI000310ED9C|nr:peptidoglycan DD-metalloendopeptidase family protein [Alkalibacillus haloalkaliphilus]
MTKKVIPFLTLIVVIVGALMYSDSGTVEANQSVEDIEKELDEVQQERENVSSEIDSLQEQIRELEGQQDETEDKLDRIENEIEQAELEVRQKELDIEETETEIYLLEAEIQELENEIQELEAEIEELEEEISELEDEITETELRIEQREAVLTDRLRTLQRNGGSVSYMEVILGSSDFGDFVSRAAAVSKVMDQDQSIINQHFDDKQFLEEAKDTVEANKEQVEESKQTVESNKETVEANKANLEDKRQTLVAQKGELDQLIAGLDERKQEEQIVLSNLQEDQEELEKYQVSLSEEQEILDAREQSLKNQKQSAESNPANTQAGGSGQFIAPMSGYLTSPFKPPHRPGHAGVDMGNRDNPTTPVYAAATGEVYRVVSGCVVGNSGCGGGYGNVVYMTHYIDGVAYDTVYAHLSSVHVSVGDTVQQGQQIGNMGNTGSSTGPHLHFEIHRGGSWNNSKSNAVDPLNYINP